MRLSIALHLIGLALPPVLTAEANTKARDAILLSQVESLTLRAGQKTRHRRVAAVPQLRCISSPGLCARHTVDVMRCANRGAGYGPEDVQWTCTARLPPALALGETNVVCEGYSSADDPYVLRGSCAVEYRLALTGDDEDDDSLLHHLPWPRPFSSPSSAALASLLFWLLFLAVLVYIVYAALTAAPLRPDAAGNNQRRPWRNTWGGGGGGGPPHDSPPPPPYPGTSSYKNRSGGASPRQQQQGWRPDLWSAAAGAAAGYGVARMARSTNYPQRTHDRRTQPGGAASSSTANPSASSSASAISSSSRYQSTGFGSTSRR